MDKTTIENLKQFRNYDQLLTSVINKYVKEINKFIKKDDNNKIIGFIVPIIVDILPNKEIIFSDKLSSEMVLLGDTSIGSNSVAACKISLEKFLNNLNKM